MPSAAHVSRPILRTARIVPRAAALAAAIGTLQACAPTHRLVQAPTVPACRAVESDAPQTRVRWWTPLAPGDRRLQAAWCGTVGPVRVQAPAAQPARAARPIDRLVLASWNVHVGGGDIARLVADLRAGRLTGGEPAADFVLLLQEVHRESAAVPAPAEGPFADAIRPRTAGRAREDIETTAERLGLHLFYVPSMRNGPPRSGGEDRGNAILSTLPLTDLHAIELPFERQRRVAAAARVALRAPGGETLSLVVASVHLDNRAGLRRLFLLAPPARTRQMRGLLDALPAGEPAVLGGDLNTWFGAAEGAWELAARAFPDTPPGGGGTKGPFRLDHLFFRLPDGWAAGWHVAGDTYGSDHRPVIGEIRSSVRVSDTGTSTVRVSDTGT